MQAGLEGESDSETVARLSGRPVLPEAYRFKLAASPHKAAAAEGVALDPASLMVPASDAPLVIEGAGGLMVPLTGDILYIDVFMEWRAPLILCARTSLGTINHTLLSLEAIRLRRLALVGIVFIGDANDDSESIICQMGGARRLGRLPMLSPLTQEKPWRGLRCRIRTQGTSSELAYLASLHPTRAHAGFSLHRGRARAPGSPHATAGASWTPFLPGG